MNKYHRHIIILAFILCCISTNALAQTTLAVLDFNPDNVSGVAADALSERLREEFKATGKYKVISRDAMMDKFIKQNNTQLTNCVSADCIIQAGNLLGADQVVSGSLNRNDGVYHVALMLVDIRSGKIIKDLPYDYSGDISDLLDKGTKEIVNKLSGYAAPPRIQQPVYTEPVKPSPVPSSNRQQPQPYARKVSYKIVSEFGLVGHDDLGEGKTTGSSGYGCAVDFGLGQGFTLGPEVYYAKLEVDDILDPDSSYYRYHDKSSLWMFGLVAKLSLYESTTSMKTTLSLGYANLEYNYRTERQPGLFGDETIKSKGNMYVGFGAYFELLSNKPINLYALLDYCYIFPSGYETEYSWGDKDDNNDTIKLYRIIVGISLAGFAN